MCGQESFTVKPVGDLPAVVSQSDVKIGVITTPADSAQDIADLMIQAGLVSILNFAPVVLNVPEQVEVRKVDLAVELQILAFHDQRADSDQNLQEPHIRAEIA
jgi:redox-sensing transcriptional repressor